MEEAEDFFSDVLKRLASGMGGLQDPKTPSLGVYEATVGKDAHLIGMTSYGCQERQSKLVSWEGTS